jgi:hypothetical protein
MQMLLKIPIVYLNQANKAMWFVFCAYLQKIPQVIFMISFWYLRIKQNHYRVSRDHPRQLLLM